MKKSGGVLFAGLLGIAAGALGGLLLAPVSGKKTREKIVKLAGEVAKKLQTETKETKERVTDIYGKVTDEAVEKYNSVKNSVAGKIAAVKTAGTAIDKEKYAKVVDDVVSEYTDDFKTTKNGATKIAGYLKKDWDKIKKALS